MKEKDLSFKNFLKTVYYEFKRQLKNPDPFFWLITEFLINIALVLILAIFISKITAFITIPWTILRCAYWIWRAEKEKII